MVVWVVYRFLASRNCVDTDPTEPPTAPVASIAAVVVRVTAVAYASAEIRFEFAAPRISVMRGMHRHSAHRCVVVDSADASAGTLLAHYLVNVDSATWDHV